MRLAPAPPQRPPRPAARCSSPSELRVRASHGTVAGRHEARQRLVQVGDRLLVPPEQPGRGSLRGGRGPWPAAVGPSPRQPRDRAGPGRSGSAPALTRVMPSVARVSATRSGSRERSAQRGPRGGAPPRRLSPSPSSRRARPRTWRATDSHHGSEPASSSARRAPTPRTGRRARARGARPPAPGGARSASALRVRGFRHPPAGLPSRERQRVSGEGARHADRGRASGRTTTRVGSSSR